MFIVRFLRFVCGYVRFHVNGVFIERFLNLASRNGIHLWNGTKTQTQYTGYTLMSQYKKLRPFAKKTGVQMRIEERFGWPVWRRKYRRRVGFVAGILLFFGILTFLGNFVWTIEVVGNETVSSDEILDYLKEEGLKVGSYKKALNPRELERKTLLELKELSWIAVNITGSTVTVEVNERILPPDMYLDNDKACNIVARYSGQIDSMNIYDGQSDLKVGDTVLAGDLIVSGIVEDGKGQTRFVHARADIKAYTEYEIKIEVPLRQVKRVQTGEKSIKKYLQILTWRVPLFWEKDREENYDFRQTTIPFAPFGLSTPFAVVEENRIYYTQETAEYNAVQAKEEALRLLQEQEKIQLEEANILERELSGSEEKGIYLLKASYLCIMEIGREQEIFLER